MMRIVMASGACFLVASTVLGWVWWRSRRATPRREAALLGAAGASWAVAAFWPIGEYELVLFWVRALHVVVVLYVAPFLLAMARPVTMLRAAVGDSARARVDGFLASRGGRLLAHPATTSAAMLAAPWLLYLTPLYVASLRDPWVGAATDGVLLSVGFCYFYARLQRDPVPRRYPQSISLLISVAESLGDGLLGLVIWLGPPIGAGYYAELNRQWGPSQRVDQSIGAGVLWLVGDVLGLVFILVLMRIFTADERAEEAALDAELDRAQSNSGPNPGDRPASAPVSSLWWEHDPQLRDRIERRR